MEKIIVKNVGTGKQMDWCDFAREAVMNSYNINIDKESFRRGYDAGIKGLHSCDVPVDADFLSFTKGQVVGLGQYIKNNCPGGNPQDGTE